MGNQDRPHPWLSGSYLASNGRACRPVTTLPAGASSTTTGPRPHKCPLAHPYAGHDGRPGTDHRACSDEDTTAHRGTRSYLGEWTHLTIMVHDGLTAPASLSPDR